MTPRRNSPLFVTLPLPERERLDTYAAKVGRPLSWTVRDALRLYLDAMEARADALGEVTLDPDRAGDTSQPQRGRPRKDKKTLSPISGLVGHRKAKRGKE